MTQRILFRAFPTCIVLLLVLMISCNINKDAGPTIVAGHLPELASREFKTNIGEQEFKVTADADGRFHLTLDIGSPQYTWFNGINNFLYLVPSDSMFIGLKDPFGPGNPSNMGSAPEADNSIVFSGGESGLINTWFAVKLAKMNTIFDTVNVPRYYSQDAVSYKNLNTWVITEFHEMLDNFSEKNPGIDDYFIELEKSNISHYWYYELNVYHFENRAYTGKVAELPDNFYDYLPEVRLNDTMLFQFDGYRYFLYSWLDLEAHLNGSPSEAAAGQGQSDEVVPATGEPLSGVAKTHQLLNIAQKTFTEPEILADVTWEVLRTQNNRMNVDETAIARAAEMGVEEGRIKSAREYMERLKPLSAGNPAPDFEIVDVNGKIARLEDFSGKYLLIDVWSHDCGPCVREIPRLEDIKHDLEGRNIEIITVCMSNEEPWKNKMKDLGLPDKGQYRLEKGWNSPFNNDYLRGSGVPTYIIIDPDGKMVKGRAPFPSDGMRELLEGLPI